MDISKIGIGAKLYVISADKIDIRPIREVSKAGENKIRIETILEKIYYDISINSFRTMYDKITNDYAFSYSDAVLIQKKKRQSVIDSLHSNMQKAIDAYQGAIKKWLYTEFMEENKNNDEDLCTNAQ